MLPCRLLRYGGNGSLNMNYAYESWHVGRCCLMNAKRPGVRIFRRNENEKSARSAPLCKRVRSPGDEVCPSLCNSQAIKRPGSSTRIFLTTKSRQNLLKPSLSSSMTIGVTKTIGANRSLFHTGATQLLKKGDRETKVVLKERAFEEIADKNKDTFHAALEIFENRGAQRRGHVEFIYAAMKYMEDFGVHKDLESYKKLMDIFPKGKMIPTNMFQMEFMHYPYHQQCAIDLLEQMEGNGVIPDMELGDILKATFGNWGHPVRKYMRMLYWMPKFKHLSPFPLPENLPLNPMELAKLAIARICGVDLENQISVYHAKDLVDSVDDTWIVSGQSPNQRKLLEKLPKKTPIYVEGVFGVYLRHHRINYFILRADTKLPERIEEDIDDVSQIPLHMFGLSEPQPADVAVIPSVHEQEDGTIISVCATGTSSRDSVLSWVRFLQEMNARLTELPIIFTLQAPVTGLVPTDNTPVIHKEQQLPKSIGNIQFVEVTDEKK